MEKKYFCAISLILLKCNNNNDDLKKKNILHSAATLPL